MPLGEGTVLGGRYRLLSRIGRGGMGVVWHAHDDILDRDVALKEILFPPGLSDAEHAVLYERTLREARSAARLNHRGIVTVHDVVEEDGRPCIVMELVTARSLQEVIDEDGPLEPIPTAEIGLQVLAALRAAHAAGITHRDVKPANVLLAGLSRDEPVSAATRVVITDFGIATMEGDATLTQTGLIMGSPAYIAPERAQGERASPASDLWALGATLYAACEGRAPHHRSEAMAAITAVISEEPPPPRRAGPLAPVLMGLLAKDPARRLDAREAAEGLRRAAHSTRPLPSPRPPATIEDVPSRSVPLGEDGRVTPGAAAAGHRSGTYPAPGASGLPDRPGPAGAPSADGPGPFGPAGAGDREQGPPGHDRSPYGRTGYASPEPHTPGHEVTWPAATGAAETAGAPRGRGRRTALAAGLLATAVTAAVVVFTLPWSGSGHATSGGSPSAAPSSKAAAPSPRPVVPPGYRLAAGPHGSQIAVPRGWVRRPVPGHPSVLWSDPATGAFIQVDCTGWTGTTDPSTHWQQFTREAERGSNLPGFRIVRQASGTFTVEGRWPAADIEYEWKGARGLMHGYDRGIYAGGRPYAVFVAAPKGAWPGYRFVAANVFTGFRPGSS